MDQPPENKPPEEKPKRKPRPLRGPSYQTLSRKRRKELGIPRDPHPTFDTSLERVRYVMHLMARGQWNRGDTGRDIAEDWGISIRYVSLIAAEASRALELMGDKEHILQLVRERCITWIDESDVKDRAQVARLLLETHGGVVNRHEVTAEFKGMREGEIIAEAIHELIADPKARSELRQALDTWDAENPIVAGELAASNGAESIVDAEWEEALSETGGL